MARGGLRCCPGRPLWGVPRGQSVAGGAVVRSVLAAGPIEPGACRTAWRRLGEGGAAPPGCGLQEAVSGQEVVPTMCCGAVCPSGTWVGWHPADPCPRCGVPGC